MGHGNLPQIFGPHAGVVTEKVSKMLPHLRFESGESSTDLPSFEQIYREACNSQWPGEEIKEKLIAGGALSQGGSLPSALPANFNPMRRSVIQKGRILVFILIRVSPGTDNDGHAQVLDPLVTLDCIYNTIYVRTLYTPWNHAKTASPVPSSALHRGTLAKISS